MSYSQYNPFLPLFSVLSDTVYYFCPLFLQQGAILRLLLPALLPPWLLLLGVMHSLAASWLVHMLEIAEI